MSAHRKPGPAVLGGCAPSSAPRHRRDEGKLTTMNRDYYHSRWPGLTEEQQREADRVAGEEMRLSQESLRLTFPPGMTVVPKSTPPSVNQTVTGGGS